MNWASDRIEREIAQNEKCERDFGTSVIFKDSDRLPAHLSNEKKIKHIEQVQQIVKDYPWKTVVEACEQAGLYHTTYYKWKKELKK